MSDVHIRPIEDGDRDHVRRFLREHWGGERMVVHGKVLLPGDHAGFLAEDNGELVGLVTYQTRDDAVEFIVIESVVRYQGTGTVLLEAVEGEARRLGCNRLWICACRPPCRCGGRTPATQAGDSPCR
ncbi:MAG: GNAT family N-acetyltransferase [Dehalococcoidia bacterium]